MSDTVTGTEAEQLAPQSTDTSGEELADRHAELERQQAGNRAAADDQSPSSPAYSADVPANNGEAQALVDRAGLNFAALSDEYARNGSLSARSYADLERAGIGREIVDSYIAGQTALAQDIKSQVFEEAGGPKMYQGMIEWAKVNFTHNQIDSYNAILNSGSVHEMRLAVAGLRKMYTAENGTAPQLLAGTSGYSQSAGDVYTSTKQITDAIRDPRYQSDPAYRQSVIEKVGRSNIL